MPPTLAISGVLPAWIVIPVTIALMLLVAGAITVAAKSTTPASRRRVRLANGWVMLLTMPMAAAGFTLIDSALQPRLFVKVWILVIGLICISVVLAILDILNTARLARISRARLRRSRRRINDPAPLRFGDHAQTDRLGHGGSPND
jgi:hypothetical protein